MEEKLHRDLKVFDSDPSFTSLHLPPMDHLDRYLVDEVVFSDYPSLVATSIGDGDERHIVVYRKGQQPKDVPFEATLVGETIIVSYYYCFSDNT